MNGILKVFNDNMHFPAKRVRAIVLKKINA